MRSFAALALVLLSTSVSASVTFPLTKIHRTGSYLKGSPDADRARAALLKRGTDGGPTDVPTINSIYTSYTTTVGIGNPATYYNLIVDTGSSNTFCGTGIPYNQTSTSIPTGELVNVTYWTAYFNGVEYLDQVTLAPGLVIANQSIGHAIYYEGFPPGVDGIIGLGPVDLTYETLSPDTNMVIPTVMNNLVSQKLIENKVLGVYFAPSTNNGGIDGALTYGGVDPNLYKGEIKYVPMTETYPSSVFWGINITSSTYGNLTIIPESTAGIVDTGTTLVRFANDFFAAYLNAIPGATLNNITNLIEIPSSSVSSMQPLNFMIADQVITMDVAAQLFPADQTTAWGLPAGQRYSVIAPSGKESGGGLDFVLGQGFLERYYTVFDADANRVGFAETNYTFTSQ